MNQPKPPSKPPVDIRPERDPPFDDPDGRESRLMVDTFRERLRILREQGRLPPKDEKDKAK